MDYESTALTAELRARMSQYVTLFRQGASLKAACPLHEGQESAQKSCTPLVIIRVRMRPLGVEEVSGAERRGNCLEGKGRLGEVETIGKIVSRNVGVAERRQVKSLFNVFQNAAKVVCGMRNIGRLGVG